MKKLIFVLIIATSYSSTHAQTERRGNTMDLGTTRLNMSPPGSSLRNGFAPNSTPNNNQSNPLQNWNRLDSQERQDMIKKMNPRERSQFMQRVKEDYVLDEIKVPDDAQNNFKELFLKYTQSQKDIKEKFKGTINIDQLTNEEAKKKLDESFEIGQQLLDNRQEYANQFLKILSPQQVLKLFQTEGKVRDKIMDKKYGGKEN